MLSYVNLQMTQIKLLHCRLVVDQFVVNETVCPQGNDLCPPPLLSISPIHSSTHSFLSHNAAERQVRVPWNYSLQWGEGDHVVVGEGTFEDL
jgi:hypothetical protein